MNPYFDLVVIGLIVFAVLVNLYHAREQSAQKTSFLSELSAKFTAFDLKGQKTPVRYHATANFSLK